MTEAKVTSKGQVTIPLEVRRRLGLKPGSRIDFVWKADGRVEVEVVSAAVADLEGVLHREGAVTLSVDEMNMAVQEEAGSRRDRPNASATE